MSNMQLIFAVGAALTVVVVTINLVLRGQKKKWKKVGKVSELFLHPVKSMKGASVQHLFATKKGMRSWDKAKSMFDRSFMVIQPSGNMMTARKESKLVTIEVELIKDSIILSAPDTTPITVPIPLDLSKGIECAVWGEKTLGLDCGDEVSQWLSSLLNNEYRLVYHSSEINGRKITARDVLRSSKFANAGNIMYHDGTPGHLLSEASLEDLNTRLTKKVTARSFRPNIVVNGCNPYDEDNWIHVKIGEAEFQYVRDQFRCILTTVDPETGIKNADENPLKTLREYRHIREEDYVYWKDSPPFGTGLAVTKEGVMSVGDDVLVY